MTKNDELLGGAKALDVASKLLVTAVTGVALRN